MPDSPTRATVARAGNDFVITFPFDVALVAAIKTLPSRRFNAETRTWRVPTSDRVLLERVLPPADHGWSAEALACADHVRSRAATITGPRITIRFPYHAEAVADVKMIDGRRWDAEGRAWTAPFTSIRAVRDFAAKYGLWAADLEDVPDADPVIEPTITVRSGWFHIAFPFDRDLMQAVRDLPTASFDKAARVWRVSASAAPEVAAFAAATTAQVDDDARVALTAWESDIERWTASHATDADIHIPPLGGDLMPFQRAGVAYCLKAIDLGGPNSGVLIADEQGLGKTVQALAVASLLNPERLLIVCPTSLRINWQREYRRWMIGSDADPVILLGTDPASVPDPLPRVCIVGWETLEAWQPRLADGGVEMIVFDEMHYAKNLTSRRGGAALRLADRTLAEQGVVIGLTGTPMLNRPTEILPLVRILGRVDDMGGAAELRRIAVENPRLLNRMLRSKMLVRRLKSEVLPDLPPKRWAPVMLPLSADGEAAYRAAEANIVRHLADLAAQAAREAGGSPDEVKRAAVEAVVRANGALALVAINELRQLAVDAKMEAAHRWLSDFQIGDDKVVIFAWHRAVVEELAERYANGRAVYGGENRADIQSLVDAFQTDPSVRVLVCSLQVAGVGLTLTAASNVVFVEQGWNPAQMDQAADRCHRIGQTDSVTAWNLLGAATIDEDLYELIAAKRADLTLATDGDRAGDADPTNVVTELVRRLAFRE